MKTFKNITADDVLDTTILVVTTFFGVAAAAVAIIPHTFSGIMLGVRESIVNKGREYKGEETIITPYFDYTPVSLVISAIDIVNPFSKSGESSTAEIVDFPTPAGCEGEVVVTSEDPQTDDEEGPQEIHRTIETVIPSVEIEDKDSLDPPPNMCDDVIIEAAAILDVDVDNFYEDVASEALEDSEKQ